jgi:hypothetical protein
MAQSRTNRSKAGNFACFSPAVSPLFVSEVADDQEAGGSALIAIDFETHDPDIPTYTDESGRQHCIPGAVLVMSIHDWEAFKAYVDSCAGDIRRKRQA